MVLARGNRIEIWDLPRDLEQSSREPEKTDQTDTLMDRERQAILEALRATDGNKKNAAKRLGISRSTLYTKLKKYGLDRKKS